MAHYRLNPLEENVRHIENFPREGQVNEVCRGWLVHEDQALAYRLQSEEYNHHFGNNRERNAILRQDTPKAREEQLREDEAAARAQNNFEIELIRQEARDAEIAAQLARELDLKEEEIKFQQEKKDLVIAKALAGEEKTKVRQAKELRQVDREAAYLGINAGLDNVAILSRNDKSAPKSRRNRPTNHLKNDLSDLSDFCLKPSPSMDEEEMRSLQEEQDEELSQLLQEQDLKRRGDILQKDQLVAIEVQDRELAKIIQEQEKARAKKSKEKARQKAMMKKQHLGDQRISPNNSHDISFSSINSSNIYETPALEDYDRPNSPQYASPESIRQNEPSPTPHCKMDFESHTPSRKLSRQFGYRSELISNESESKEVVPTYTNIACAIDPTYQRRIQTGELCQPTLSPTRQINTSTNSSRSSTCSNNNILPTRGASTSPQPVFEDDEDFLPPPYMPIQGQRRISSLEKPPKMPQPKRDNKNSICNQQ